MPTVSRRAKYSALLAWLSDRTESEEGGSFRNRPAAKPKNPPAPKAIKTMPIQISQYAGRFALILPALLPP